MKPLKPLWNRIDQFELDAPESAFKFSQRLARENAWTEDYSLRVIAEYKRFLYLCCEADHPVTPPVDIDEAWHLHLCYTRSYWDEFCAETLGRPIHHGPTKGGAAEQEKFVDCYQKTLNTYRLHFDETPPADIWPAAGKRFEPDHRQKVDPNSHLIIRRSSAIKAAGAGIGTFLLAGCTKVFDEGNAGFVFLFVGFVALSLLLKKFGRGGGGSSGCDGGCAGCGD